MVMTHMKRRREWGVWGRLGDNEKKRGLAIIGESRINSLKILLQLQSFYHYPHKESHSTAPEILR